MTTTEEPNETTILCSKCPKCPHQFSYSNSSHYAHLSRLAYEIESSLVETKGKEMGYDEVKYFDKDGAQCYALSSPSTLVLAFRGTETSDKNDVTADLKIYRVSDECECGIQMGSVHRGFKDEVDTLWEGLVGWLKEHEVDVMMKTRGNQKQVITCGHSLGGAMSGIAASRIPGAICYNFGCPRIGDWEWATEFGKGHQMYRFVHDRDVVPRIPPAWMKYSHCGDLHFINKYGNIRKNPNLVELFFRGCAHMIMNPFRITQGVSDHDIVEYCQMIDNWGKDHE